MAVAVIPAEDRVSADLRPIAPIRTDEGQRRYVESLSSYAREFLGALANPEVESIDGLSPAFYSTSGLGG